MPYTCTLRCKRTNTQLRFTVPPELVQTQSAPGEAPQAYTVHPLKVARIQRNLTQQMLADFTQVSLTTIQRAERGEATSIYTHQRLCDYFGMNSVELGLLY